METSLEYTFRDFFSLLNIFCMIPAFLLQQSLVGEAFMQTNQLEKLHSLALQAVCKGFRFVIDIIVILRVERDKKRALVDEKLPVAELFELSS